ncbi:MAG: hypothetical protein EXS47_01730 [Candidatus Zambryskibacteria bacterium]|nr:hypothetical protein [Candidatus Zambryskibacteria bacterium]
MTIKILKWVGLILLSAFVVLVIVRMFVLDAKERTAEQVAKIHATKLTLDDVMGKNLPPDPGGEADKTIQGVDANKNGIRDDVELAIFKEYPNSAKTRAVLLQYALALQMEVTQSVVNEGTVGAISNTEDGAFFCITKIVPGNDKQKNMITIKQYENFVLDRQINTDARKKARNDFYKNLGNGSVGNSNCDIDINSLHN